MTCPYEMIPAKQHFPAWQCHLDEGHAGKCWAGEQTPVNRDRIRDAYFIGQDKKAARQIEVSEGVEVDVEALIKRSKTGAINTQSTLGKVVKLALDAGCEVRAWRSDKVSGIVGAHHGLRFSVAGASVLMNNRQVRKEELLIRLEEMGAESA